MDQYLRPKEAARMLGIGRSTLYLWAGQGLIPRPLRLGNRCSVFRATELQAAVNLMLARDSAKVA